MKNGSVCHRMLTCSYYNNGIVHPCKSLEHFNMTSSSSYWCSETINRWSCWCSEPILWGLNIFLVWKRSFVAINLHRCWPQRKEALNRFLGIREFSIWSSGAGISRDFPIRRLVSSVGRALACWAGDRGFKPGLRDWRTLLGTLWKCSKDRIYARTGAPPQNKNLPLGVAKRIKRKPSIPRIMQDRYIALSFACL